MAAQHRRGEKFSLLAPIGRHLRRSSATGGAHRAASERSLMGGISDGVGVAGALTGTTLFTVFATLGSAEPATTVVVGEPDGGVRTSITAVEFVDATTARILGCGLGDVGLLQQQALVLTGSTLVGATLRPQLGTETLYQTPTGVWNCATGTITAATGTELSGIAGEQHVADGVNSWTVDNPLSGEKFGDEPTVTHSGPGVPPNRATKAQAGAAVQAALLGTPPGSSNPPVVRYRH